MSVYRVVLRQPHSLMLRIEQNKAQRHEINIMEN